jgi:DNA-binding CsgD family transcriptional regulator
MIRLLGRAETDLQLLERDAELEAIRSALQDVRSGSGRAVRISGPPGIGKTELLRAATGLASSAGLRVLAARAVQSEEGFAFGVARQLMAPLAVGDSPVGRLSDASEVGRELLAGRLAVQNQADRYAALNGLYWLLVDAAESGPLMLAVDDLQWCDETSAAWLGYVSRRLTGVTILLVLATRNQDPAEEEDAEQLTLAPLSQTAAAEVARAFLGEDADPAFVDRCHELAGGNPFMLVELCRELLSRRVRADADALSELTGIVPGSIRRAVLVRLARLGPAAVELARAVAVLERDAELQRCARLAGISVDEAGELVDGLIEAQILAETRPLDFVHPLARIAVYEDLSMVARALAHGRAARLLAQDGAGDEDVALHLMLSEPTSDPWVVQVLLRAAETARGAGATSPARAYLRRALAEPPTPEQRFQVLRRLGRLEAQAYEPEGIAHLQEALGLAQTPHERVEATEALGAALAVSGEVGRAIELVASSMDDLDTRDPALVLRLGSALLGWCIMNVDHRPVADVWAPRLVELVRGDSPTEQIVLAHALIGALLAAEPRTVIDRLRARLRLDLMAWSQETLAPIYGVTESLIHHERYEDALAALEQPSSGWIPDAALTALLIRAQISWYTGRPREAAAELHQSLEMGRELGSFWSTTFALRFLVLVLIELGELDEAERVLEESGLTTPGVIDRLLLILAARGTLRLAKGDAHGALEDLQKSGARAVRGKQDNPAYVRWRGPAAVALQALGRGPEGIELAAQETTIARRQGGAQTLGIALRTEGLLRGGQQGLALLEQSVAVLEGSPAAYELARSKLELGAALRRAKRRLDAREPLRDALAVLTRSGSEPLKQRAREELLATGARPRRAMRSGVDALTPSELRVARLAAEGLSNREIAQRLYVTQKTVEDHLGASYRKLAIGSRRELVNALQSG